MEKIFTFCVCAVRIEDHDDDIHISGPGFSGANTLCGITDDGEAVSTDGQPDCSDCIEVYESIKKHRPRFKF